MCPFTCATCGITAPTTQPTTTDSSTVKAVRAVDEPQLDQHAVGSSPASMTPWAFCQPDFTKTYVQAVQIHVRCIPNIVSECFRMCSPQKHSINQKELQSLCLRPPPREKGPTTTICPICGNFLGVPDEQVWSQNSARATPVRNPDRLPECHSRNCQGAGSGRRV